MKRLLPFVLLLGVGVGCMSAQPRRQTLEPKCDRMDVDGDGDYDLDDFAIFADCMSGPGVTPFGSSGGS